MTQTVTRLWPELDTVLFVPGTRDDRSRLAVLRDRIRAGIPVSFRDVLIALYACAPGRRAICHAVADGAQSFADLWNGSESLGDMYWLTVMVQVYGAPTHPYSTFDRVTSYRYASERERCAAFRVEYPAERVEAMILDYLRACR